MKKLLALLLVFLMLVTTVVGCSESKKKGDSSKPDSSEDVAVVPDDEEYTDDEEDADFEEDAELVEDEELEDEPYEDYEDDYNYEDDYDYDDEEEEDDKPSVPLTPEEQRLEKMLLGEDAELNKDAIYNEGNLARLAKAMNKSKSGKEVVIVFYGNAVNTGMNGDSNRADTPYSRHIEDWWRENVGPCTVINSGLENLTSANACMRVDFDVLQYKPDLVFLDFSVQDAISKLNATNAIGFDNLVRLILQSKTAPAIVTLLLTGAEQTSYSTNAKNANMFASASKEHKVVSKYYNLPVIDFENAVWENFTELVKVTTQTEIPLINWSTVGLTNISMNNNGHMILGGAIKNFLTNNVLKKLNKISTKDPSYPKDGYFGSDRYMKGSFITVGDMMDKKANGYSFDLDAIEMEEYEYGYYGRTGTSSASNYNSMLPNILTYRHYIPVDPDNENDASLEENPHYLTLTVPEVTNPETFFMIYSSSSVSSSYISSSNITAYAPIALYCYDKDGKLTVVKAASSYYSETTSHGKTSATKIPVGTTKIEFRLYTRGGSIRLLGMGEYK